MNAYQRATTVKLTVLVVTLAVIALCLHAYYYLPFLADDALIAFEMLDDDSIIAKCVENRFHIRRGAGRNPCWCLASLANFPF